MVKILISLTVIIFSYNINVFSQDPVKDYELPAVIEGSNLSISGSPFFDSYESPEPFSESSTRFNINFEAYYTKWRFTNRLDYSLTGSLNPAFSKSSSIFSDYEETNSRFSMDLRGGAAYYLIPDKFYMGSFISSNASFSNNDKPHASTTLYPNAGYGRLMNAFIIRETSNFEDVLLKEGYIKQKFDRKTRDIINKLLDKRNGKEFLSKYKDDEEIEFFTKLEEVLLKKGVIEKPLNARTTMSLYRTLQSGRFILFPVFKGFQLQAELALRFNSSIYSKNDSKILILSSVYGLPLSFKTGMLFSAFFANPLDGNYLSSFYDFDFHSPIVIRSSFQYIDNISSITPDSYYSDYTTSYLFKGAAALSIFHNFGSTAGISGNIQYSTGKVNGLENSYGYGARASVRFLYNILSKLYVSSSVSFSKSSYYKHSVNLNGGFYYYIF